MSFNCFVVEAQGFVGTLQLLDSKQSAQVRQLLKTNTVKAEEEEVEPWKRVSDVILQIVRCFVGSRLETPVAVTRPPRDLRAAGSG